MSQLFSKTEKEKLIFITGKGGVGKSTISATIGLYLSQQGYKTLVIDIDPAHSLGDAFGIYDSRFRDEGAYTGFSVSPVVRNKPIQVYEDNSNLDLMVIEPVHERMETEEGTDYYAYTGYNEIMRLIKAGIFLGIPANLERFSEVNTLINVCQGPHNYDKILIDTEPSAGLLTLLSQTSNVMRAVENMKRQHFLYKSILKATKWKDLKEFVDGEYVKNVNYYSRLFRAFNNRLEEGNKTTFIVVTNPESGVVQETKRLISELRIVRYLDIGHVVFNKVFPGNTSDLQIKSISDYQKRLIREFIQEIEKHTKELTEDTLYDCFLACLDVSVVPLLFSPDETKPYQGKRELLEQIINVLWVKSLELLK